MSMLLLSIEFRIIYISLLLLTFKIMFLNDNSKVQSLEKIAVLKGRGGTNLTSKPKNTTMEIGDNLDTIFFLQHTVHI